MLRLAFSTVALRFGDRAAENASVKLKRGEMDRLFPLTPALSRREREGRIPLPVDRDAAALRALTDFPPLPAGEGRGEGERGAQTRAAPSTPPAPTPTFSLSHFLTCFIGIEPPHVGTYMRPSCSRAASVIMPWFHGGSQTSSTFTSSMPSRQRSLFCTSCTSTGPMPQPGAVSVIFTSAL